LAAILSAAFGAYPHTEALKKGRVGSDLLKLEFVEIAPINRAFAPMVRERRFDVSEMAIATFLQAKAYGVRLTLLPIAVAARFQESALLTLVDSAIRGPGDLASRRVGVRAYSQTTGLWLRGALADDFGLTPGDISWVTFEGAHVAEYADPDFVTRAAPGKDMLAMLRAGDLDAVIVGNDAPDDPAFRTVFPDPSAAADAFWAKRGFVPINHMIVVRSEIAEDQPEIARELCRMFAAAKAAGPASSGGRDRAPMGRAAVEPSVVLAMRYAAAQGLLPRALAIEEIWRDSPTGEFQNDWRDNASGQVRRGGE
jgi:4,5-dihydroxyphthalate decarboxylase